MRAPGQPLRHDEARERAALLHVEGYDVRLRLEVDEQTFASTTTIRFTSTGGPTWVDLKPLTLAQARLDGAPVDIDRLDRGRLPLQTSPGSHELVVEATMRYRNDGEGLHRSVDPADGRAYVYGMSFMDAAPSIFACFDQPDLKAPYTVHVEAPEDWVVFGNGRATQVAPGQWELATTEPLATYFVTIVAGPYAVVRAEHDGIALSLSARASLAATLEDQAEEILTITRQSFDELHRLFGVRYAFGDYHQAFVPEFNAGAMENPGCVTIRDQLLFTSRPTRGARVWRAALIAHEMAHQWFGNLVTPRWWDDLWLNESFAEYLGNRVAAEATEFGDAWVEVAYMRRQWGLTADLRGSSHPVAGNGAVDAQAALQDFDGISYAKGSAILRQFNAMLGDEAFFGGAVALFEQSRFGNVALADLVAAWEQASGQSLAEPVAQWLRTVGPDRLAVDRAGAQVTCTVPDGSSRRQHAIEVARHDGATWVREPLLVDGDTPFAAGNDPVLLDPDLTTWASVILDTETVAALPRLLPTVDDPLLRASLWSAMRSSLQVGAVSPASLVDVVVASPPVEDADDTLRRTLAWIGSWLLPLAPSGSTERVHAAFLERLDLPDAEQRRMALWGAVRTASDEGVLRRWLSTPPAGLDLDSDLRWRLLRRLAVLGATTQGELDDVLAADPSTQASVEHTRASAAQPTAAAKAFAWQRFTGEVDVPNYELEAAGAGLWASGHDADDGPARPYLERYFAELPATAQVRSGWVLASASAAFFPAVVAPVVLHRARDLLAAGQLEASVARQVADAADDLAFKLAVAEAYGR